MNHKKIAAVVAALVIGLGSYDAGARPGGGGGGGGGGHGEAAVAATASAVEVEVAAEAATQLGRRRGWA